MIIGRGTILILVAALSLLSTPAAMPQNQVGKTSASNSQPKQQAASKAALAEASRVSTTEIARSAAEKAAKTGTEGGESRETVESAVIEFHAVAKADSEAVGDVTRSPKDSKKSPSKNIHGTAYGSLDNSGNHSSAASVGASSKGGKAHIFVETERSRSSSPPPH